MHARAVWKRSSSSRCLLFDLVVLDLNMPDITGIEVLEFLAARTRCGAAGVDRHDPRRRSIPQQVLKAGASSFSPTFTPDAIIAEDPRTPSAGR